MGVHLIPQPDFGSDLQTEVSDCLTGTATAFAMIGSSHWTLIEHFADSASISIENRMQRTTRRVIATENAVIDWAMAHRALGYKTLFVKLEKISAHHIVGQPTAVDRCYGDGDAGKKVSCFV